MEAALEFPRSIEGWLLRVTVNWRGVAAGSFAVALLAYGVPALAQTTPESNGSIQLHLPPIQLHMPGKAPAHHKRSTAPAKASPTRASAEPQAGETLVPYASSTLPGLSGSSPVPKSTSKKVVHRAAQRAAAKALPASAPSRAERRKAVEEALTGPASAPPAPSNLTGFSFDAAPAPEQTAPIGPEPLRKESSVARRLEPRPAATTRKSADLASLEAPPRQTAKEKAAAGTASHANMTKQGEVLFPHADADPQADGAGQLKTLAAALNSAMDTGHGRVEIEAFGGPPGDKSSDSRRLSLRRALAVRQLLIDGGVPSDRIDVKALGGIEDHGNADRVDVFLSGNS